MEKKNDRKVESNENKDTAYFSSADMINPHNPKGKNYYH